MNWAWEVGTALIKSVGMILTVLVPVSLVVAIGSIFCDRPFLGLTTLQWFGVMVGVLALALAVQLPTRPNTKFDIWTSQK